MTTATTTRPAFALYVRKPGRGQRWQRHSTHPTREAASYAMFALMEAEPPGTDFNVRVEAEPAGSGETGVPTADTGRAGPYPYPVSPPVGPAAATR